MLASVLAFKNASGYTTPFPDITAVPMEPLDLSEAKQTDLIAFLETLTSDRKNVFFKQRFGPSQEGEPVLPS